MTSRQRILAALRLEQPDRVPVSPFTLGKLDLEDAFTWEFIRCTDPILTLGGGGQPFLGGTASGTYTEKGARNFMALVEVAREYGRG